MIINPIRTLISISKQVIRVMACDSELCFSTSEVCSGMDAKLFKDLSYPTGISYTEFSTTYFFLKLKLANEFQERRKIHNNMTSLKEYYVRTQLPESTLLSFNTLSHCDLKLYYCRKLVDIFCDFLSNTYYSSKGL